MLTVCLLVCSMLALTRAGALPEEAAEKDQTVETNLVKRSFFCSTHWTLINGRCFRYIPVLMTWARAERHCRTMDATLASVLNMDEYHEIQKLIRATAFANKPAWIGGSDAAEENIWLWSDGRPFHYSNWCHGEPNNVHTQNCLQVNHGGDKCWDNLQCSVRLPSVCVKRSW